MTLEDIAEVITVLVRLLPGYEKQVMMRWKSRRPWLSAMPIPVSQLQQETGSIRRGPATRARFVIEVLQSGRRAVGDDFPISLRLLSKK
jgi:hypothetical protein